MRPPRRSSTAKGPPIAGKPGVTPSEQDATDGPPGDPAAAADRADPGAGGMPVEDSPGRPGSSDVPPPVTTDQPEAFLPCFTIAEMAARLGISARSVRRRIKAGLIRTVPIGGRLVRIPATELTRLLTDPRAKRDIEETE